LQEAFDDAALASAEASGDGDVAGRVGPLEFLIEKSDVV